MTTVHWTFDEPADPLYEDYRYRVTMTVDGLPIRPLPYEAEFVDGTDIQALTMQLDGVTVIGWMRTLPELNADLLFGYRGEPLLIAPAVPS